MTRPITNGQNKYMIPTKERNPLPSLGLWNLVEAAPLLDPVKVIVAIAAEAVGKMNAPVYAYPASVVDAVAVVELTSNTL